MEFNEEKHEYTHNGSRLFSVSEVLPETNFYCSAEQLERARVEGVENHAKIKMFLDTNETFDDPYIEAFEDWYHENRAITGDILFYEKPLLSIKYVFAGRPDMIFEKAIVDLKRNFGNKKIHSLQTAGYHILAREHGLKKTKRWLIVWEKDGVFKTRNVYDEQAEAVFLACLSKYKNNQLIDLFLKSK